MPLLFAAITAAMVAGILVAVRRAVQTASLPPSPPSRAVGITALVLTGWLAYSGFLAWRGALSDFSAVPPRFALVLLPALIGVIALSVALSRGTGRRWLRGLPQSWIVGAQSFRFFVEIALWLLYVHGGLAALMTFHGRNFDILVGLTAPVMAWLAHRRGKGARGALLLWNIMGIGLLVNVAAHGILSTPTPFRVFVTDPPNMLLVRFPYVWLPAFLVPLALLLHLLSLLKLRDERCRTVPPESGDTESPRLAEDLSEPRDSAEQRERVGGPVK
ncbi:MAG: hypothetical protein KY468_14835 [Armatimonadetes bacterium]|nr:hypothetical protein [Armatimonadota bacterium]